MNRDVSSSSRLPGALPADRRRRAGNGTGCKGVRFKGNGMYEARIKLRDRPNRTCLGRFKSALEAMRAYDDAARVAGYCVNECGAVGDLLDSDTYAQIGVATQQYRQRGQDGYQGGGDGADVSRENDGDGDW